MPVEIPIFEFNPGASPLLISVPHSGTCVPDSLAQAFTATARALPDTDWLVDTLYGFAKALGAGMIRANYSRYVVDLNRPPDDASLYDGRSTGLFPLIDFTGAPIFREHCSPAENENAERLNRYWYPYHYQLQGELNRLQLEYGHAVLLDAHSIAAEVPMLFSGRLPDFNLGTNDGKSADQELISTAYTCLDDQPGYSSVLDGRFKGGYITRHYGSPSNKVHALQLELSQATYLATGAEIAIDPEKYRRLQPVLEELVESLVQWKPHV